MEAHLEIVVLSFLGKFLKMVIDKLNRNRSICIQIGEEKSEPLTYFTLLKASSSLFEGNILLPN